MYWLMAACTLVFPIIASAQNPAATPGGDALRPGDAVKITVWQKPEMSGEFIVAADGSIADPFYMEVNVANLPFAAAAQRIRAHVERFERTNMVLVEPLLRISVGGEVRTPNLQSVRPETTIAQAVMLAGGPSERGNLGNVKVFRDGREIKVNANRVDNQAPTLVRSGDLIVVTRKTSLLRDRIGPLASVTAAIASLAFYISRSID
jgi:polysaccharide export outer membrane protein